MIEIVRMEGGTENFTSRWWIYYIHSFFSSLTASNGRPLDIAILSYMGVAANDQGYALVLLKRVHGRLERRRRTNLAIASDFDDLKVSSNSDSLV